MNVFLLNYFAILLTEFVRIKLFTEVSFLKPKYNAIKLMLLVVFMFLYTIISLYTNSILRFILLNASTIVFYKTLFSAKIKDIFYYICVIYILTEILSLPVEFLSKCLVDQSYDDILLFKYVKLYVIFLHTIVLVILLGRKNLINSIQIIYVYSMKHFKFFLRIIETYCFITFFHVLLYKCDYDIVVIFYTIYLLALTFHLVLVAVYYLAKINTDYISMEKYNVLCDKYNDENKEYRDMRHNLLNDLLAIKTSKFNDEVIDRMVRKYKKNYQIDNDLKTNEFGINGILDIKMKNAEMLGVKIAYNKTLNDLTKFYEKIDYLRLCEAIGIVMDNAIEAAMDLDEKIVYVDIDTDKGFHMKVINKFLNAVDIDKMFINNYSTKKRSSGLGLNYLYGLKSKGIYTKINIVDDTFIVSIDV
ncbi:GHKL domain-containing protein [bacterium]|nr:GHKL domain-containing protein [bacterium]